MNVQPTKSNVLVAQNKDDKKSESGIILDKANSVLDSKTGTVLAIGPDVTEVKVGDKILLEWNKAKVVNVDGSQRVIIKESDIVAVF